MSGGLGPWYVSLLFNTSKKCKKQTHLVAHTSPHLVVDFMNKPAPSTEKKRQKEEEEDCWIMIVKIGPFDSYNNSCAFKKLWTNQTRGKMRRLERGVELFNMYRAQYNLKMWSEVRLRDDVLKLFFHPSSSALQLPPPTEVMSEGDEEQEDQVAVTAAERKRGAGNGSRVRLTLEDMKQIFNNGKDVTVEMLKDIHVQLEAVSSVSAKKTATKKQKN